MRIVSSEQHRIDSGRAWYQCIDSRYNEYRYFTSRNRPVLLPISIIIIVVMIGTFFLSVQLGILFALLTKPIIDASWSYFYGDISPVRVVGVLVPFLVLLRILTSDKRLSNLPLFPIWMIYVVYVSFVFSFNVFEFGPLKFVELAFRALNGFVGYFMIQTYFSERDAFKKLLQILIVAGLFPTLVGVYQIATGVVWYQDETVGLVRYSGLYHDIQTPRQYMFQTFTAIILYWCYFLSKGRSFATKLILIVLFCLCAAVLFRMYSKAGVVIVALWVVIWSIGRRKFLPMALMLVALVAVNLIFQDRIWSETTQLFSRETSAIESEKGGESSERERKASFSGRWYTWDQYMNQYLDRPWYGMVFGTGNPGASHNDFLANMLSGGIVGLFIYVTLLFSIGVRVFKNYLRSRSPLNVMALMLFAMWIVDAIGLVPSLYPSYQWYVWGLIGLSLKGVQWDTRPSPPSVSAAQQMAITKRKQ
jgi:O-antigen ligase